MIDTGFRAFRLGGMGIVLVLAARALAAQQDTVPPRDTIVQQLAPVVTVTRERGRSPLDVPYAVSTVRPDSARPGQRHMSLDETLLMLPGVTVANRTNPSQDPRISIRGFGARSQFGVRGIRILRDGMPITLPDGQTPVDYLDLESIGQVEVIRGSAASLYGNGAGGVIELHSAPPPVAPLAGSIRGWGGSNALQRWTGTFGGSDGAVSFLGDVSHTEQDGYRDYSHQRVTSGYARADWRAGQTHVALQGLAYDMPLGQNPGALTLARLDSSRTMADPFSVVKRARKQVTQLQVGLSADRTLGRGEVSANVYGGTRDLYNPLTFAVVDVGRTSSGAGARYSITGTLGALPNRFTVGIDAQWLNDLRRNWANCNGVGTPTASCPDLPSEKGAISIDQRELVSSVGPYVRDEITLGGRYRLSAGVRADNVRFQVEDHLITPSNPDNSGVRTLHAVSPMVGLDVKLSPMHALYASVSSAFETPTTTELGNKPDGSAGINPDLKPQYSTTYEVGAKGLAWLHVSYSVALFDTEVRDELIQYEVPGGAGRTYYRNAGRTRREGAELGLTAEVGAVELGATYSYAHYRFRQFVVDTVNLAGNEIPGIPTNQFQAFVTWRRGPLFATAEGLAQNAVFVDDANTTSTSGYTVFNLRLGATSVFGNPWVSPVLGVQNLFDKTYVGSVAVNATGGKYFEPSPGRTFFAGMALAVGR